MSMNLYSFFKPALAFILSIFIIFGGVSFADNVQKGQYLSKDPLYKFEIDKSQSKYLPFRAIIIDSYFEKTNSIFLINGSYLGGGGNKEIVEYDLPSRKIVKNIFQAENASIYDKGATIHEYSYDSNFLAWSLVKNVDSKCTVDVYVYDIVQRKSKVIEPNINCGRVDARFPLSLKVSNGRVAWIEHDLQNELSRIKVFDIAKSKKIKALKLPFLKNESFPFQSIYIELHKDLLFFTSRKNMGSQKIVKYDLSKNKAVEKYKVRDDMIFHYTAEYNEENDYLAFYAKSKKSDLLYVYELDRQDIYNLVRLDRRAQIYKDRLVTIGKNVLYSVQLNSTGRVQDHFYGEVYDIRRKTMEEYRRAVHIDETEKYFTFIQFNENYPFEVMHFSLYRK